MRLLAGFLCVGCLAIPAIAQGDDSLPWISPSTEVEPTPRGGTIRALDLAEGFCNREILGHILEGGRAAFGSQLRDEDGRLALVEAGAILGVLPGGEVGGSMDRSDALCVDLVLEYAPDGRTVLWQDFREAYGVTPRSTFVDAQGLHCREFLATSKMRDRQTESLGTACRQPGGSWRLAR